MRRVLLQAFFKDHTITVANRLLGKFLVRRYRNREIAVMITEVEAYDGPEDKASHASRGRTTRNSVMFGEGGKWYVYFIYGMYWMLNIVTGRTGYPAAILVRGGLVRDGKHALRLNGPGKLTRFLKIDRKFNGLPASKKTGLWIEDRGTKIKSSQIKRGKRIGVDYAGAWAGKLYNFRIQF